SSAARDLLHALDLVAVLFEQRDDRILARQVTRADRNHDAARLSHALLDPFAPGGVALQHQRLLELRRGAEVAVEGARDRLHLAFRPRGKHSGEFVVGRLALVDRPFEQRPLTLFREGIEEGELLDVALELADRLALAGEGAAKDAFDARVAL